MIYTFLYPKQHKAQAVALFCIDFRFKDAVLNFLKRELNLTDLDIVALAGATKSILASPDSPEFKTVIKQFEISLSLHKTEKIVIVDHADCGAYGGKKVFKNVKEERDFHIKNLKKAKAILVKHFPKKEIVLVYADLKDEEEILFEVIK